MLDAVQSMDVRDWTLVVLGVSLIIQGVAVTLSALALRKTLRR